MFRLLAVLLLLSSPALAQTQNPSFNLINKSAKSIKTLYVSPTSRTDTGKNWLPTPVAAGATYAVRLPANGDCIFDIRAIFADGSHEDHPAMNICKSDDVLIGTTAAAANVKLADDPSFRLVNHNKSAVTELMVAPTGKPLGANRLETPLASGSNRTIKLDRGQGCAFDLRVVMEDKSVKNRKATDLCKITDLPIP